jgi:DNA-binding NarL/FixJ family response regulator
VPIIENEKVNVVLLDIRLPDKSGIDVLKDIRAKHPNLPVVMLTAYGYDEDLVEKTISLGASAYVSKTVSTDELMMAINNALRK